MRFRGSVFRTLDPRWAWAPLSGEGAKTFGGRFNPIGVSALYTSLSYEGAMRERIGLTRTQPVITCEYDIDVEPVFNSLDKNDMEALKFSESDLNCPWEDDLERGRTPRSHLVASRLIEVGYAGLLVRSFGINATFNDLNLVLWDYGEDVPRKVKVVDDERLLEKMRRLFSESELPER